MGLDWCRTFMEGCHKPADEQGIGEEKGNGDAGSTPSCHNSPQRKKCGTPAVLTPPVLFMA